MLKKVLLTGLVTAVLAVIGIWYFIFYRPTHFKRSVADETAITIVADSLISAYQKDEPTANAQYLNKALSVTGTIKEIQKDQEGKQTITLSSIDPFTGIHCTLINPLPNAEVGMRVTVKGICTGFLSDVVLIDAIVQ